MASNMNQKTIYRLSLKVDWDKPGEMAWEFFRNDESIGSGQPDYELAPGSKFEMEVIGTNFQSSEKGMVSVIFTPVQSIYTTPLWLDGAHVEPRDLSQISIEKISDKPSKFKPKLRNKGSASSNFCDIPARETWELPRYDQYKLSVVLTVDQKEFSFDPTVRVGPR